MQRLLQRNINKTCIKSIRTLCGSRRATITLESAVMGCKNCEFFESRDNTCRAFAFVYAEPKTVNPEFVTIMEARSDPQLCGIDSKMLLIDKKIMTNYILGVIFFIPCAIFVITEICKW